MNAASREHKTYFGNDRLIFQISGIGNTNRAISVPILSTAIVRRFPLAFRHESNINPWSVSATSTFFLIIKLTFIFWIWIPVSGDEGQSLLRSFSESNLHREWSALCYRGYDDYKKRRHQKPPEYCDCLLTLCRIRPEARVETQKSEFHTPQTNNREISVNCIQLQHSCTYREDTQWLTYKSA